MSQIDTNKRQSPVFAGKGTRVQVVQRRRKFRLRLLRSAVKSPVQRVSEGRSLPLAINVKPQLQRVVFTGTLAVQFGQSLVSANLRVSITNSARAACS